MHMPVGTIANAAAIVAGSLVGLVMHGRFPENLKTIVFQALGLAVSLIGVQMAVKAEHYTLIMVFSVVLGGIIGELLRIEDRLEALGQRLKRLARSQSTLFTEGFVSASIMFCVGAMAILGSIDDGLRGDPAILLTKATLDGFASIALASKYGVGVMFSAVPILLYQGAMTLAAGSVSALATPRLLGPLTATGGLLIVAIGINLLGLARIKAGNLLPALAVAVLLSFVPI